MGHEKIDPLKMLPVMTRDSTAPWLTAWKKNPLAALRPADESSKRHASPVSDVTRKLARPHSSVTPNGTT
jgi:hypothetical protein